MAKGPDWNDEHRANPGAIRDAMAEPDIPFDKPKANGGTQKTSKFQLVAWKDIDFHAEDEWRVDGVLPRIGLASLYGGPGAFKTFIWLDLFQRMARGGLWGGREVKQSPVVYIAAEGAAGITKRIAALKKVAADKGLAADIPFYLISVAPNLGTGEADNEELIRCIKAVRFRPGAIAIDTAAQPIGGADENGGGMAQLVANGTAIANHFGCLVGLVHHNPLADEDRLRGWTGLLGGLDVSILSKREKGSLVATLNIKKMKDEDDTLSFTVTLVRIILGHTKSGREISTLVVESVEPGTPADASVGKCRDDVEIISDEYLKAYDRLADGVTKDFGLDGKFVLKVSADSIREELKSSGILDTNDKGAITPTSRSHLQRAKIHLLKTKGGKLVQKRGLVWRP
jgi:hypothetical protein